MKRHEVLRTIVREVDLEMFQEVISEDQWTLVQHKIGNIPDDALEAIFDKTISKPFNLANDVALRVELLSRSAHDHFLVVVVHHIASDGWSMSILVKEFLELYKSRVKGTPPSLPVLPIQYADYAVWQRQHLQGELLDKKLNYWREKLTGVEPLYLPADYTRPALQSMKGSHKFFLVDSALANELESLSKREGANTICELHY